VLCVILTNVHDLTFGCIAQAFDVKWKLASLVLYGSVTTPARVSSQQRSSQTAPTTANGSVLTPSPTLHRRLSSAQLPPITDADVPTWLKEANNAQVSAVCACDVRA
jgi:hypothetical protein